MVLSVFGVFPQNACSANSPARAAATLGDGRKGVNPCGTYERKCTRTVTETIVAIKPYQWHAFSWAPNNLTVQASAFATIPQAFGGSKRVPLWCISFRKYDPSRSGGRSTTVRDASWSLTSLVSRASAWSKQAADSVLAGFARFSTSSLSMLISPDGERKHAELSSC